jgi:hypothetical protein
MNNWDFYVRESYELIKRAENELTVNLPHEIEAYLVHLFAYYMDKPRVNTVPVGIRLLSASTLPVSIRKEELKAVGDECLLIHSMGWGQPKWPSSTYYADIGQTAYMSRAYAERPPEGLFDDLAYEFATATRILSRCRIN